MLYSLACLIVLIAILLITVYVLNIIKPLPISDVKYPSIEGIRGYLAFFVFIHHGYIWYHYLKTNTWEAPESNLFNHFGQSSVLFFFMITSFLFTSKLIEAKGNIDWKRLYVGRFFRLFPMYLFSIIVLFSIVVIQSKGVLYENTGLLCKELLIWISFTIGGNPEINAVKETYLINAGVAWSLPYEWMFYFCLPLLGLVFKVKTPLKTVILTTVIVIVMIALNKSRLNYFLPFVSGIIVAVIAPKIKNRAIFKRPLFGVFIIIAALLNIYFFHEAYELFSILIATFIFLLIVLNNSILGILHLRLSKQLGQITYSFYLTHGIILYIVFRFINFTATAIENNYWEHWKIIAVCIIPITIISHLSYCYIEKPFMKLTDRFVRKTSIKND